MSKIIASLFVACMFIAVPGQAQEPTKQAEIERILDLTNSAASVDKILDQMTSMINSQMKAQMPKATPEQLAQAQEMQNKMVELIKSRLSWTRMRAEYVKVDADLYSDSEIEGLLAFYESPAGRGYLEKMPLMAQRMMAASQAQMGDLMPEIQRIMKESAQKKQ